MQDEEEIFCSIEGCDHSIKNHAWGKIKAEGWFFLRNGTAFCPDHIPDWVAGWRESRRR